jgi:hypothetical protein
MPNLELDWFEVKDPHPASLVNIQRVVDHMVTVGATNKFAPISLYAIAKAIGRQQKQITQLIRDRPGFIRVESNGKSRGYYYDSKNFGMKYPAVYGVLRTRNDLLAVEDVEQAVRTEVKETVQEFNDRMPELAKKFRQEVNKTTEPDIRVPLTVMPDGTMRTLTIETPAVSREVGREYTKAAIQELTKGGYTPDQEYFIAQALLASLLSLMHPVEE